MVSSLGPLLANIYMAHLEENFFLKDAKSFTPTLYRRYVDETFCLFADKEHADLFLDFINGVDDCIQFDKEEEKNSCLSFLDTNVTRVNNNIYPDISTRVKPTDRGLFYNANSFIPDAYKTNLTYCLIYRIYHIASSYAIFHIDLSILKSKFLKNGFSSVQFDFDTITQRFLNKQYLPEDAICTVPKRKVIITLPFSRTSINYCQTSS